MSEEGLKLSMEWSKRLGVNDWHVKLKDECVPSDMTYADSMGESEYVEATKTGVIRILREDCYGDRIRPFDYEKTLVHELLHLKFALLGESGNDLQDRYVHQLIDDMARALVDAKRAGGAVKKDDAPC